ncbi:TonB family protein [Caulobacter ginsengisoli]|uniref:TonB family protein n=1 Tax=Caulobacter ginsengisoli TaxID=400775 RepID=A0ABU0IQD0_9CAUL|nr:energy transducer TonB [Caulobacter ginsengisoli]MDQ0464227.1 TonB family protein [Caulobacter ginsengisoli]
MNDPVEYGEGPRWGLRIALGLVAFGLIGAWAVVWLASSGRLTLPEDRPRPRPEAPPIAVAPPPRPKPFKSADGQVVTNPDWSRRPTGDDVARYYPERAQRLNIGGRAVIACTVALDGRLVDCKVVSETPPDQDFGPAAVRMSSQFRMWPKTVDGEPVEGGEVRIPIVFTPPG